MPLYKYKAQELSGRIVKGTVEAVDELDLHNALKEQDLALIKATDVSSNGKKTRALRPRILSNFCLQMSEMLSAGIPLVRALDIVAKEESNKPAETTIYESLIETVTKGNQLSQAMEETNGAFPPLLMSMVRSAEEAGNLAEVFRRMHVHYDKEHKLNTKVKSSTTYPKILAVLIVVVVAIIVGFVLPQFKALFDQMPELPLATRVLLGITDFVTTYWLGIIVAVILIVVACRCLALIDGVRHGLDKAKVKLPIIGRLNATICTARFARTFSSLYTSGVNVISSLQIGSKTIGNLYLERQFDQVVQMVRNGHSLSDALGVVDGLNNKFIASVRVGEESGSLESMLNSVADSLDFEAEQATQRMVDYLGPVMIIILAIIVFFVIVSVIVPIYTSYSTIGTSSTMY